MRKVNKKIEHEIKNIQGKVMLQKKTMAQGNWVASRATKDKKMGALLETSLETVLPPISS